MREKVIPLMLSILIVFLVTCNGCQPINNTTGQQENPDYENLPLITTYYWDKGGWIKHTSWRIADFGKDVTIDIDAWNGQPQFSPFSVTFDNIIVFGDMDPIANSEGVVENFSDGIINDMWHVIQSEGASVYELDGVLNIDIFAGPTPDGFGGVGGVVTKNYVIHGDFDVQVDFSLCPEYHNTPNCNAKLFITDENEKNVEISIRTGQYVSRELSNQGKNERTILSSNTNHLNGKIRITRTSPISSK